MTKSNFFRRPAYALVAASTFAIMSVSAARAAATTDAEAIARENWREEMAAVPTPGEGCFMAAYPSKLWTGVGCAEAPRVPFRPTSTGSAQTVGNGADYAIAGTGLISKTIGSFPVVKGVTSETGAGGASNTYSLQLNSNFMTTAACNGIAGCASWQQFIYSSSYQVVFMQYWLIGYGATCPSTAWNSYSGDCYRNSAAIYAPQLPITDLATMKVSGHAVKGGTDTVVFTGGGVAYSVSGKDTVVDLATAWAASEFNIVGDGGGSEASFNTGSSITVKVAITDGSTAAPACIADAGTTGETNNLNLKTCTAYGGTAPYAKFVERN